MHDFTNFKNGNETELTCSLKWAEWKWLSEVAECRVIGYEVRLEGPFDRIADVVGLGTENRVYLIEVKSSRADLSRDDNNERTQKKLRQKEKSLQAAAELTNSVLAAAKIAASANLTSDLERAVAITESDATKITTKSASTKKRIETLSTKLHDPAYLRCADFHYIMAPDRMIRSTEVPDQWGLLNERAEVVIEAPQKQVKRVTQHVLRAIARANTRDLMKACEVNVQRTT